MVPVVCVKDAQFRDNDSVIFFNFRPDRAREITRCLVDEDFYHGVIGLLEAVPPLVPVHGVVPAHHSSDLTDSQLLHLGLELLHVPFARGGRHVTAVQKAVNMEITRCLVDEDFNEVERKTGFIPVDFICTTEYDATMPNVTVAYPRQKLQNIFGEYISNLGYPLPEEGGTSRPSRKQ